MINLINELDSTAGFSHIFMSTYNFDPAFFENRILKLKNFQNCPNIYIFIDANNYRELCNDSKAGNQINRRYMLIPVVMHNAESCIQHSKLWLFVGEKKGSLFIGSANLTRSGITNNMELMSAFDSSNEKASPLFYSSLIFFENLTNQLKFPIVDLHNAFIFIKKSCNYINGNKDNKNGILKILDSFKQPILDKILEEINFKPTKVCVISPFFDSNTGGLIKKIQTKLKVNSFDLMLENYNSTLDKNSVENWINKNNHISVKFFITTESKRRLHAKGLVFINDRTKRTLLFIGSSNFTFAGLNRPLSDNGNIEAGVLVENEDSFSYYKRLLNEVKFAPVSLADIETSDEKSIPQKISKQSIRLYLAKYIPGKGIEARVECDKGHNPSILYLKKELNDFEDLKCDLITFDTKNNTALFSEPIRKLPDCSLQAWVYCSKTHEESNYVWLTDIHEVRENENNNIKKLLDKFRYTGDGFVEFITLKLENGMTDAALEYLETHNIKFNQEIKSFRYHSIFRTPQSPIIDDDYLHIWKINQTQAKLLYVGFRNFVCRHYDKVLKRHLNKPNIGGLCNFMDVLETCVKFCLRAKEQQIFDSMEASDLIKSGISNFFGNSLYEGFHKGLLRGYWDNKKRLRDAYVKYDIFSRILTISNIYMIFGNHRLKSGWYLSDIDEVVARNEVEKFVNFIEIQPNSNDIDRVIIERYSCFENMIINNFIEGVKPKYNIYSSCSE
jgi:HKD family nuclease